MTDYIDGKNQDATDSLDATDNRTTPAIIEKFVIRLPKGLRNKIKHLSEKNRRSMNSEIIMVLEQHIQQNLAEKAAMFDADLSAHLGELQFHAEAAGERSGNGNESSGRPSDSELTRRLENLPEEKKQALLELLG